MRRVSQATRQKCHRCLRPPLIAFSSHPCVCHERSKKISSQVYSLCYSICSSSISEQCEVISHTEFLSAATSTTSIPSAHCSQPPKTMTAQYLGCTLPIWTFSNSNSRFKLDCNLPAVWRLLNARSNLGARLLLCATSGFCMGQPSTSTQTVKAPKCSAISGATNGPLHRSLSRFALAQPCLLGWPHSRRSVLCTSTASACRLATAASRSGAGGVEFSVQPPHVLRTFAASLETAMIDLTHQSKRTDLEFG